MPRMIGFDLATQILRLRPGFPVLMTSGFVRPEDQRAAEELGIRRIITKPSTLDQLGEALAEAIHSRQVPATPSQ
jgi:two-component system capsular synthesis sensor histidine kinase RcsC